ncbi:SIS domain-containing protein, partial [Acinetobacter baumannii]
VSAILEEAQKVGCETLAITNVAGSRLTHDANITLNLEAGEERSVAATTTYTASLLAVFMLVRVLDPSLPFSLAELPTR